jgi:site-specific DNA recombinase
MLNSKQTTTEKKTAAIYCRVSTDEQASKEDNSLEIQESVLRIFCEKEDFEVYDVYADTKSGKSIDRIELNRLREDASKNRFQILVATKLDRLSRNVKNFLDLDYELQQYNIDIKTQSQNFDTTTPSGRMLRMMLIAFAEFERDMISERTSEASEYRAKEGHPGGGLPPLGYDRVDKFLVVNEEEAENVRYIFNSYLEEPSTRRVANRLNEQGYRTKVHKVKVERTNEEKLRGGGLFTGDTVHRILTNVRYWGKVPYKGELYEGKHDPIITEEIFNLVQDQLQESKTNKHRTKKREIPTKLNNILYCGFCANKMTGSYGTKNKKPYYYYKCTTKIHGSKESCPSRTIKMEHLENFIFKITKIIMEDHRAFKQEFRKFSEGSTTSLEKLLKEEKVLLANLANVKAQLKNLNAVIKFKGIENSPQSTLEEIANQEISQNAIQKSINDKKKKIEANKRTQIDEEVFKRAYENFTQRIEKAPIDVQRDLFATFFERITSHVKAGDESGHITIKFHADGEILEKWANLGKELTFDEISSFRRALYPGEDSNLRPTV